MEGYLSPKQRDGISIAILIILVLVLVVLPFIGSSIGKGSLVSIDHLQDVMNPRPGQAGGPSWGGILSDSRYVNPTSTGGGVVIAGPEHLVPGVGSWPSPDTSTPRKIDFRQSPCDARNSATAAATNAANAQGLTGNARAQYIRNASNSAVRGLGYSNSMRGHDAGSKLGQAINANYSSQYDNVNGKSYGTNAGALGKEHLAATWKRNEYLTSASADDGVSLGPSYEHAHNNRTAVYDPMRNRFAANSGQRGSNTYAAEHLTGLEAVLTGM